MGPLSLKSGATVILILLVLLQVDARKRKQAGRDEQELDDFSGDSYSEFVDKYYKNSQISSPDSSLSSSAKKGGSSRTISEGSGDGTGYGDDGDDEEDEDDEEDIGSGHFPTDFGGDPFATDDEDFHKKTSKIMTTTTTTTTTTQPSSTTRSSRRRTTTTSTTTTTEAAIDIDDDLDEDHGVVTNGREDDEDRDRDQGSGSGDVADNDDDEDYDNGGKLFTSSATTATTKSTTTTTTPTTTTTTTTTTKSTVKSSATTATTLATTLATSRAIPSLTTITTPTTTTTATTATLSTSESSPSTTNRPFRKRPALPVRTTTERITTTEDPDRNSTLDGTTEGPAVLVSNHILVIALYTALVFVLCLSILIALCLLLRWRSQYVLANTSEEGSNSDSASSDLPIIKRSSKGQIVGAGDDLANSKSHYARRHSPSAPPLMPQDLNLDVKSTSFQHKRRESGESGSDSTDCFGRTKSKPKSRKSNEWY